MDRNRKIIIGVVAAVVVVAAGIGIYFAVGSGGGSFIEGTWYVASIESDGDVLDVEVLESDLGLPMNVRIAFDDGTFYATDTGFGIMGAYEVDGDNNVSLSGEDAIFERDMTYREVEETADDEDAEPETVVTLTMEVNGQRMIFKKQADE